MGVIAPLCDDSDHCAEKELKINPQGCDDSGMSDDTGLRDDSKNHGI